MMFDKKKYAREWVRKKRQNPEFRKLEHERFKIWAQKNRVRRRLYRRDLWKINPNLSLASKDWYLRKRYGITLAEYQKKIENQKGLCPICQKCITIKTGALDHNHITGQIRDVLCSRCNVWLGYTEKTRYLVDSLLTYLDKWNMQQASPPEILEQLI